jgi:hypothetical protein
MGRGKQEKNNERVEKTLPKIVVWLINVWQSEAPKNRGLFFPRFRNNYLPPSGTSSLSPRQF